jgi:hypothetical protein
MSRWLEEREKSVEAQQALVSLTATKLLQCKAEACTAQLEHSKFAGMQAEVQQALAVDRQEAIDRAAHVKRKYVFMCLHAKLPCAFSQRSLLCTTRQSLCRNAQLPLWCLSGLMPYAAAMPAMSLPLIAVVPICFGAVRIVLAVYLRVCPGGSFCLE